MEGTSQHEVVVAGELAQARMELAVVDEAARFADDEEGEDNPVPCQPRFQQSYQASGRYIHGEGWGRGFAGWLAYWVACCWCWTDAGQRAAHPNVVPARSSPSS